MVHDCAIRHLRAIVVVAFTRFIRLFKALMPAITMHKPPQFFLDFFPPVTHPFITLLMQGQKTRIWITNPRKQRSGSFSVNTHRNNPVIRINNDLKPYMFLLVFLHEMAHLLVWQKCGNRALPHGKEWKEAFRDLLLKLADVDGLDQSFRSALFDYVGQIKASLHSDKKLSSIVNQLDGVTSGLTLSEIPENTEFLLSNGRRFVKLSRIRTRYKCFCPETRKYYLVSAHAQIIIKE